MVEAAQTEVTGQIEVIEAQLDGLTEEDEAYVSLLEQKTALEAKQTELAQQLFTMQEQKTFLEQNIAAFEAASADAEARLAAAEAQITDAESQLAAADAQLTEKEQECAAGEAQIASAKEELESGESKKVLTLDEALQAAQEVGYPVLMRPSYVLGGQNMIVAYNKADIIEYMGVITEHVDMDHPVLLDKYIMGTECEVDAICDGENFLIPGIMEQVERTGVHSGDSICVYPAQHLTQDEIDTMVDYTGRFARELHVTGLVNVQYAVSHGRVYVIEVNPRSSRTVPYISKVTGVPMVDMAVRCCLGEKLVDMGYGTGLHPNAPYVAVKVPVFSFEKLHAVDTQFGPEMKSTGEVLGIAPNYHDALLKGLIGAGYTFKTPGPGSCCIFTVKDSDKPEFVDIAWKLKDMGYKLYGTSGTCAWLNKHMVPCNEVRNISGEAPNIVDLLQSGLVDYVFSTSAKGRDPRRDSVRLRRKAVELSIPCITAVDTAASLVDCLRSEHSLANIPLVDIATLYRGK